jgi:hypothetical protein
MEPVERVVMPGFYLGYMFKVNRNRLVISKQYPSISSSISSEHSCDVRTGQRDSAGIEHGNELQIGICI